MSWETDNYRGTGWGQCCFNWEPLSKWDDHVHGSEVSLSSGGAHTSPQPNTIHTPGADGVSDQREPLSTRGGIF